MSMDQSPLEEAALVQMLRQLPIAIIITKRDDTYIWQCFTANGTAETFLAALQGALIFLETREGHCG